MLFRSLVAIPVLVVIHTPDLRVLLLERADHPGFWQSVTGSKDSLEEPLWETCQREVREETGLNDLVFDWGADCRETPPYRGGKVARYYIASSARGEVYLPVSEELGRPEHHEFRWLDYPSARARLAERVKPILDWANALVTGSA